MDIRPDLEQVKRTAAEGIYKVLPVSCEILSDSCTPIEALRILKSVSQHCCILESLEDSIRWGAVYFPWL